MTDPDVDLTVTGSPPGTHAEQDSGVPAESEPAPAGEETVPGDTPENFTGPPIVELTEARQAELAEEARAAEEAAQEAVEEPQTEAQKAKAERRAAAAKLALDAMEERAKEKAERRAAQAEAQPDSKPPAVDG